MAEQKYKSESIFAAVDTQARKAFAPYETYRNFIVSYGPNVHRFVALDAQQYGFLLVSLLLSLGLFFSLQGDFYTGRHNWQPNYPDVWLSFVVILMLCGLIAGIACGELFRETRLFHAFDETSKAESLHLDSLVDKIYGIKSQNKVSDESKRRRAAWLVIISCYLVVTGLTGYQAFQKDNVFIAILTQLYFFGACLGGVGVFWLGRFILTIYAAARNRRAANHALALLRPEYELVATVYQGARQRFFDEHPELNNDESKVPPIPPLAAFMAQYPCREGIEIPKELLEPKKTDEDQPGEESAAAAPEPTPPPKDTPPEAEPDPFDQPEDSFGALDSNSDKNSEKL